MSTEATTVAVKSSQDLISLLPNELRICILETVDHRTPDSGPTTPSGIQQQSDLSNFGSINKDWHDSVSRYKLTKPFVEKNKLYIKDLTSILLGRAAGTVQVGDGDTVKTILDRNGARERLATSPLATAATWMLQEAAFARGDSVYVGGTSWSCREKWFKQTLDSLDWLGDHIQQEILEPPQTISCQSTEPVELDASCLLTCSINREPLLGCFLGKDVAKAMVSLSNACSNDSIPILHMRRLALEGLDTIPQRAVFYEGPYPARNNIEEFKPEVPYALDHTIEMNMSNPRVVRSDPSEYVESLCSNHLALLNLSTSSDTSSLTLSFAAE